MTASPLKYSILSRHLFRSMPYKKRLFCFPIFHREKDEMNIITFYVLSAIIIIILVLFCLMVEYYEDIGQRQINDDQEKHISKYEIK